jgi:tetratricopeptide (TPR) repeat protein
VSAIVFRRSSVRPQLQLLELILTITNIAWGVLDYLAKAMIGGGTSMERIRFRGRLRRGILIIAVIFLSCCAPTVRMSREVAAPTSLPGVKSIAVLPFSGRSRFEGETIASKISVALAAAGHFTVVERGLLDRILDEQQLALSGLADDSTGAKIGKLTNSDAVITGNISSFDVKNFNEWRESKQKGRFRVYFREVILAVDVKIIHATTGSILSTFPLSDKKSDGKEDPNTLESPETLLALCADRIAQGVRYRICPRTETFSMAFDKGKGGVSEALKAGLQFAKNNLPDRALESFQNIAEQFPSASPPIYDQGVVLFQLGRLDDAEQKINKAIDLYPTSKLAKITALSLSTYSEALSMIQEERRNQYKLGQQKADLQDRELSAPLPEVKQTSGSDVSWRRKLRIAVVIPEVLLRRQVPDPAGETKIIQLLIDAGFRPLEQTRISYLRYTPEVASAIEDAAAAAALARKLKVDIIIIGEAFGEEAGGSAGFQSWRARLEARAIYTDTQEIICAVSEFGSGADLSDAIAGKKALESAGSKVGGLLINRLDEYHNKKGGLTPGARASSDEMKIVQVIVESANIRLEPTKASAIMGTAKSGEQLRVLDRNNDWLYIQKGNGLEGWIHSSLIKEIK